MCWKTLGVHSLFISIIDSKYSFITVIIRPRSEQLQPLFKIHLKLKNIKNVITFFAFFSIFST